MDAKLKCVFEMPVEDNRGDASAAVSVVKTEQSSSPPQVKNEEKVNVHFTITIGCHYLNRNQWKL